MQVSRPEVRSLPEYVTVTAWLYQPLASMGRDALPPLFCGAVASYLSENGAWPVLPALSVQEPVTLAVALSGPEYAFGAEHESRPDMASLPLKLTESAWLYQPLASAARAGLGVAPGAVLSILKVFETVVIPPSLSALQVSVMPVVSALSVRASHPSVDRMIDSGSTTLQLTVTVVTYHPFEPSCPR